MPTLHPNGLSPLMELSIEVLYYILYSTGILRPSDILSLALTCKGLHNVTLNKNDPHAKKYVLSLSSIPYICKKFPKYRGPEMADAIHRKVTAECLTSQDIYDLVRCLTSPHTTFIKQVVVDALFKRATVGPGWSPLLRRACRNNHPLFVRKMLLSGQFSPFATSAICSWECFENFTLAIEFGHVEVFEILCSYLSPKEATQEELRFFEIAIENKNHLIVRFMVDSPLFNVNKSGPLGRTPIGFVTRHKDDACVRELLKSEELDLNKPCEWNDVALFEATTSGSLNVVARLLEDERTDPNVLIFTRGTILCWLVSSVRNNKMFKLFMGCPRVCVNKADEDGNTPLHIAVSLLNRSVIPSLLAHPKIDTTLRNADGLTALEFIGYGRKSYFEDQPEKAEKEKGRIERSILRQRKRASLLCASK